MRKARFTLTMLAFALVQNLPSASGQSRRFSGVTSLGSGISLSSPGCTPFDWRVAGYYHPASRWSLGAGTGISVYEKVLIPLYGDIRFSLTRPRKFTPFLSLSAGYAFAPSRETMGGLHLSPSLGMTFPAGKKLRLQASLGYEVQKLERVKTHSGEYFSAQFLEGLTHTTLMLRLGIPF